MACNYLMAIDAGTDNVGAVLLDLEGNQVDVVQQEWDHKEDPRYLGSMDFDWVRNWELASGCIHDVLGKTGTDPKELVAISTTCMQEGTVLCNATRQEVWTCANVSACSEDEVVEPIRQNPEMEKEIYLESGQTYTLGALPRLLWLKNKVPELYEKIATAGMFSDWPIYKLTGVLAVEPNNGSTTGILDLQKRDWDPSIAEKCGLRTDISPAVTECGKVVGSVSEGAIKQTGLAAGIPVVSGGDDAQLGCVGVDVVSPGQAAIFGGSFWQYEFNTINGKTDPGCRMRVNCHVILGVQWYEALAFKPGLVVRWFRDGFCELEKQQGEESGKDPYYLMDKKAAEVPTGCYGTMCAFSDVMNFARWQHTTPTFTNFESDPQKFNRYTFYRSVLENTAMITKDHLNLVREATQNMPTEIIFAGGTSKSPLWCQILSDVLGLPVKVPVVKEATALGVAVLAGVGVGIHSDAAEAAQKLAKWDREYQSNAETHALYLWTHESWRKVYVIQLELCREKLTKPMWSVPGV